jgi:transposase InsO family protein
LTHLLVAIDKFTKWIEVRPLAKIGSKQAVSFIQNIIFYFGVPNSIITDNGTQFTGEKILDFCDDNNIQVDWATVSHLHTNGQVERANGLILQGLKPHILTEEGEDAHARLSIRAGKWAAEVPSVLWSLRTMPNRSTNFTPFLWCMVQWSCCPLSCSMGPLGSRPTNRLRLSKHGRMSLTCLKNQGTSMS